MSSNKFSNLFQNAKEYLDPIEGDIQGSLPDWVNGIFMRIGPGIYDWGDNFTVNYFLDGLAVICKIEFKQGKVFFMQKILESDAYIKGMIVKKPVYTEFGTRAYPDLTKNIFSRMFSTLVPTDLTDNNVGSIYKIGDEIFSSSETCFIHSIDPTTLLKKQKHDYSKLCGTMLNTAHPIKDSDGTTWNIGATVMSGLKHHVIKIPPSLNGLEALSQAKIIATIPSSWRTLISYNHSFTITQNYVILMEQPYLINCVKMAQIGIKGKSIVDCLEWDPKIRNRFHLIEKKTGNVIKTKYFTSESYFVFHFINSYETSEGEIVVDLMTCKSPQLLLGMKLSLLRSNIFSNEDSAQPMRFVIPILENSTLNILEEGENVLKIKKTLCEASRKGDEIILVGESFGEPGCELPTINYKFIGREYKYFYASGMFYDGFYKNSICKINVENSLTLLWRCDNEDEFCGEPIFIPKNDKNEADDEEDDGCVISAISSNDPSKNDYLVILNATDLKEESRVYFSVKFAQTLHGTFIRT